MSRARNVAPGREEASQANSSPAPRGAQTFELLDSSDWQFCAFTDHGMTVQSLMTMHGDLQDIEQMAGESIESMRSLVNFTCSFDFEKCTSATVWIDYTSADGQRKPIHMVFPPFDDEYTVASHGRTAATLRTASDTFTVDTVAGTVTYVHSRSAMRGEGPCVARRPQLMERVFDNVPGSR